MSDNELIELYLKERDESAIEKLIRRHSPMVWGVCNHLLWRSEDAEDAYQATFVLLVSKAHKLLNHVSIGGWLHETTVRTCLKFRRQITRVREIKMEHDPSQGSMEPWQIIASAREQEALHQEIMQLPEHNRDVIVLCHLEGRSRAQAAMSVRRSTAAVKGALTQGRKLLRQRLLKRGIGLSTVLGAVGASGTGNAATVEALAKILEPLVESTLQACLDPSSIGGGVISHGVQTMVRLPTISARISYTGSAVLLVVVIAIAGGFWAGLSLLDSSRLSQRISIRSDVLIPRESRVLVSFQMNTTALNQNVPSDDIPPQEDDSFRVSQVAALENELALISEQIGLDAGILVKIRAAVKDDLDRAVKEFSESESDRLSFIFSSVMDEDFEKAVWKKAREVIPANKLSEFDRFVVDALELNEIKNVNAQKATAQFLSNLLSLSVQQETDIEKRLALAWNPEWNVPARLMVGNQVELGVDILRAVDIEGALDKEQLRVFQDIQDMASFSTLKMASNSEDLTWELDELRKCLNVLMDLRIREIETLCKLLPEQKKQLVIAKKGAVTAVVTRWKRAFDRIFPDPEDDGRVDFQLRCSNVDALKSRCLTSQCTSETVWTNTLKKTLKDKELDVWTFRAETRRSREREAMVSRMIESITGQISLSKSQYQLLFDRFVERIELTDKKGGKAMCEHFLSMEDDDIAQLLSVAQLEKVKGSLDAQRGMAKHLRELSEDE